MARCTFGQALAEANRLDAEWGTQHRGDAVLTRMLEHVADKRTRTLAKSTAASGATHACGISQAPRSAVDSHKGKKASVQLLAKSRDASAPAAKKPQPKPQRRTWTPAQVAAALDDGVKRGRISGTAAVAAMKAFEVKR